ncbi:MAG TPA: 30S ribosomal protein S8, partial [Flavobacteriales bacterium]|nr:30S ribosomal protein S8 [Flavobacteriales bacterium]
MTDSIADYLTRVRNAIQAKHKVVNIPASNIKKEITKTLMDKGYIRNYIFEDSNESSLQSKHQGNIKIALKYDEKTKQPAITKLERISR